LDREACASGGARADRGTDPDPAANIREIFAVILQLLVCANVPSISKKTVPSEGRAQWRLGSKRGLFGGRLGNGAYVPSIGELKHRLATAQAEPRDEISFLKRLSNNTRNLMSNIWCR
jgi:hypothetical protein